MKLSKRAAAFLVKAEEGSSYWLGKSKLDFAVKLHQHMKAKEIKNVDLAARINSSAPYITKVLRGDANLSIESMVKLAHAVGGELTIDIKHREAATVDQWKSLVVERALSVDTRLATSENFDGVMVRHRHAANVDIFKYLPMQKAVA